MSLLQTIGIFLLYLVAGAIVAGFIDVDPDDGAFYLTVLIWPVALLLLVLIVISLTVSKLIAKVKEVINGQS